MESREKSNPLLELGSTVEVDIEKINDNIPIELRESLSKSPLGEVIDYRITDGTNIGLIIRLKDGKQIWIFPEEIKHNSATKNDITKIDSAYKFNQTKEIFNNDKDIRSVLNPINFIKWLKFSTKDLI